MTGNDKSTKSVEKTDQGASGAETPSPGSDGAEPQVRPPRDTSGEIIAVDVDPPSEETNRAGEEEAAEHPDAKADLREQLEKKQNQLLRVAADFENYKKRSRRDAQEAAFWARNELLQELLPVIDNVELALAHTAEGAEGEKDAQALREGVEMVLRQFQTTMEKYEVKAFDSLGEPFDPNFHEALQQRETDEHPPGVIMEEYRRGYLMGDRLIRPAMVVVAAAPAADKTSDENADDGNGADKGEQG
jgi:molecular chaperone GrpE